jgi:tRNA(Ile)-lysidine synthase
MAERWSSHHLRLHRWLQRRPELLPAGAPLLLAVSGGQDSMALVGLLQDLQRLHRWELRLWHGDHRLRPESSQQADALQQWALQQGLPLQLERWAAPEANEAAARRWRYGALEASAQRAGIRHVVTGHTASDRAETLLLQLARGSHRRGLASLRPQRPLGSSELLLSRPLLLFSRLETARICEQLQLPIWLDGSNQSPCFSRNRLRLEVLPVLEQLHPGASRRISGVAERLAQEHDSQQELLELALAAIRPQPHQLQRRKLMAQQPANQRLLLQAWLQQQGIDALQAEQLEALLARLAPERGPGCWSLPGNLELQWDRERLQINQASASAGNQRQP